MNTCRLYGSKCNWFNYRPRGVKTLEMDSINKKRQFSMVLIHMSNFDTLRNNETKAVASRGTYVTNGNCKTNRGLSTKNYASEVHNSDINFC
jgi:hypothetical protein